MPIGEDVQRGKHSNAQRVDLNWRVGICAEERRGGEVPNPGKARRRLTEEGKPEGRYSESDQ